jgi:hypothetical protein
MISFWTNWCLSYGDDDVRFDDSWCGPDEDASMPPYLFNMVLQGVDFVLGEGNPGAVGVYMVGAQGSTVQDVSIFAADDALAGIAGGNGGGGVFAGVSVIGGRFGLDARKTDGSATYTSFTFTNQSCASMLVGPGTGSTSAMIGMSAEGSPSMGGVVAAIDLPGANSGSECYAPMPVGGWRASGPYLDASAEQSHAKALLDPVSLIDVSLKVFGGAPCVTTNASLWIQNLYSEGCANVVVSGAQPVVTSAKGASSHVVEFALGRQDFDGISSSPFKFGFPSIVDGQRTEDVVLELGSGHAPHDLVARHHWGTSAADWQSKGAVDALDLGAIGDGVTDDWQALQTALDENDIVVLPQGLYRLSQPLRMHRRGAALIGVGDSHSFLMPVSNGFHPEQQPVLDMAADDATVKGLSIVTWSHFAETYAMRWSGTGVWRQAFTTREPEAVFQPFRSFGQPASSTPPYKPPVNIDRPLVVISGGGAFYDFDLDFGCCFGNVLNPDIDSGPEITSTDEVMLQRPGFRTLLVNGSTAGLRFYPHNTEQAFSDAYTEIANSFNVTLYNAKSENNYAVVWIRDSDLVSIHGYGGNACPFPNSTLYGDESDIRGLEDHLNYAQFTPSSFRIQRSTRITLANIVNQERTENPSGFISAGNGYSPQTYNMILYQDGEGICDPLKTPDLCMASPVLDRPVLWRKTGPTELAV